MICIIFYLFKSICSVAYKIIQSFNSIKKNLDFSPAFSSGFRNFPYKIQGTQNWSCIQIYYSPIINLVKLKCWKLDRGVILVVWKFRYQSCPIPTPMSSEVNKWGRASYIINTAIPQAHRMTGQGPLGVFVLLCLYFILYLSRKMVLKILAFKDLTQTKNLDKYIFT